MVARLVPLLLLAACAGEPEPAPAPAEPAPAVEPAPAPEPARRAPKAEPVADRVDVNAAAEADLAALPGVGEKMAHEFEEYRPYKSIRQFRRAIGKYVDAEKVATYEQVIYVPIDVNGADRETLLQLPGLESESADGLMEGRPYDSVDAFAAALAAHVSPEQLAVGRAWLRKE